MKSIKDLALKGKTVFIRADLNVPLTKDGSVADDHRIQASLPTIKHALAQGAKVVLASHLGRPKGREEKYSLKPVAGSLKALLGMNIKMAEDCIGDKVTTEVKTLKDGELLLLENLRFHPEEEKNNSEFAKALAALCDVYVNDAFATAHRAHASTEGMTHFVKEKAAGFTLKEELDYFAKAFDKPERPVLTIFGGAKVSTKMEAIKNVVSKSDMMIIGGAMANTFFLGEGLAMGKSLVETEQVENAKAIKALAAKANCELLLPVDLILAKEMAAGAQTRTAALTDITPDEMALDVGPKSVKLFSDAIAKAKTIVWNGPMGAFEIDEFASGTFGIIDALSVCKAITVAGGGDTDLALSKKNAFDKMSYVSTAGGAFLELLEGKTLPGVKALS